MMEKKKQNVSIRMNASDIRKIREVARRLQVRDSDVFRFAVKNTLTKMTPLHDKTVSGADLVPVFMEFGHELTTYFDLDLDKLENIINKDVVEPSRKVDRDDLELLIMSSVREYYAIRKLQDLSGGEKELQSISESLKEYFSGKYLGVVGRKNADATDAAQGPERPSRA